MSDEATQTDGALKEQTNAAEQEPISEPSKEDVATETADSQLNYDELLTAGKRSLDSRKGLSRKELREAKAEIQPEEAEEKEDQESASIVELREMRAQVGELKDLLTEGERKKKAQSSFDQTLVKHGVDKGSFNGEYKAEYITEFQDLVSAKKRLPYYFTMD